MWELVILLGVSVWGAGAADYTKYPSKEACYESLQQVKIESGTKGSAVAFCRPLNKTK